MKFKPIANVSSRWPRRFWLVLALLAMAGFLVWKADLAEPHFNGQRDSEYIQESIRFALLSEGELTREPLLAAQVSLLRAQLGDERLVHSLRKLLRNRPSDARFSLIEWWESDDRPELVSQPVRRLLKGDRHEPGQPFGLNEKAELSRHEDVVRAELDCLALLGPNARALIPELTAMISSKTFCNSAALALGQMGLGATSAVPALLHGLVIHTKAYWDLGIADALGKIDPEGTLSAAELVRLVHDPSYKLRSALLPCLGLQSRSRPGLLTNLWPLIRDPNWLVSDAAIESLAIAGQLTPELLASFRAELRSGNKSRRWLAVRMVIASGTNAADFVPELRAFAVDKSSHRWRPLAALCRLMSNGDLRFERRLAAAEALASCDDVVEVIEMLNVMDRHLLGAKAVPAITDLLASTNAPLRVHAVQVLGELGPVARPALPQLQAARSDGEKRVREAVEVALPKISQ